MPITASSGWSWTSGLPSPALLTKSFNESGGCKIKVPWLASDEDRRCRIGKNDFKREDEDEGKVAGNDGNGMD